MTFGKHLDAHLARLWWGDRHHFNLERLLWRMRYHGLAHDGLARGFDLVRCHCHTGQFGHASNGDRMEFEWRSRGDGEEIDWSSSGDRVQPVAAGWNLP